MFAQVLSLCFMGLFPSEADLSNLGKNIVKAKKLPHFWWPKGVLVSNSRDTLSFWMWKTSVPENHGEEQLCA